MPAYSDLQQINQLYAEHQQVEMAVKIIDAGGTITSFVVSSPATTEPVSDTSTLLMPSHIYNVPMSSEATKAVRKQLEIRGKELAAKLAALGIK